MNFSISKTFFLPLFLLSIFSVEFIYCLEKGYHAIYSPSILNNTRHFLCQIFPLIILLLLVWAIQFSLQAIDISQMLLLPLNYVGNNKWRNTTTYSTQQVFPFAFDWHKDTRVDSTKHVITGGSHIFWLPPHRGGWFSCTTRLIMIPTPRGSWF